MPGLLKRRPSTGTLKRNTRAEYPPCDSFSASTSRARAYRGISRRTRAIPAVRHVFPSFPFFPKHLSRCRCIDDRSLNAARLKLATMKLLSSSFTRSIVEQRPKAEYASTGTRNATPARMLQLKSLPRVIWGSVSQVSSWKSVRRN